MLDNSERGIWCQAKAARPATDPGVKLTHNSGTHEVDVLNSKERSDYLAHTGPSIELTLQLYL